MKHSFFNTLQQKTEQRILNPLKHKMITSKSLFNQDISPLIKQQTGLGKTILITGASSGIGAAMATHFAKMGYNLAICARREERLEQLKTKILNDNPKVHIELRTLDVSDYDAVFMVFAEFQQIFGIIDRIIVNAGIGEGRRVGTGRFHINRKTAEVDFISALAQCEAAMQIFRKQNHGHLVAISSMSALRGMPKHLTVYAASKAALAHLAEGIRAEMLTDKLPIKITTLYPGYIRTEINKGATTLPFEVNEQTGSKALITAIESGVDEAYVPAIPWMFVGKIMKILPLPLLSRLW